MSDQRQAFTLMQLRAFADDRVFELEGRWKVRGEWKVERTERDVMAAYVALIDRLQGDPLILKRLKAKGEGTR